MYLMLALLADVLDHQEAVHGARTDGFSINRETIGFAGIFILFLFMNVEKYSNEDHAVIAVFSGRQEP